MRYCTLLVTRLHPWPPGRWGALVLAYCWGGARWYGRGRGGGASARGGAGGGAGARGGGCALCRCLRRCPTGHHKKKGWSWSPPMPLPVLIAVASVTATANATVAAAVTAASAANATATAAASATATKAATCCRHAPFITLHSRLRQLLTVRSRAHDPVPAAPLPLALLTCATLSPRALPSMPGLYSRSRPTCTLRQTCMLPLGMPWPVPPFAACAPWSIRMPLHPPRGLSGP